MKPYYSDEWVTLYHGDCLDVLRTLPDASVDSVVTDPPYGLEFMGKEWDAPWKSTNAAHAEARTLRADEMGDESKRRYIASAVNKYAAGAPFQAWCELWARECLRVLKPGGHLLAFGGTRTSHRLACAIEDAGFEIRDSIAWLYGSGFPKSLDVSKAIDRANGNPLAFREFARAYAAAVAASPLNHADIDRHLGIKSSSCYWAREDHRGGMPPRHHWEPARALLGLDESFVRLYDEAERAVIGSKTSGIGTAFGDGQWASGAAQLVDITAPATPDAERWQGWGTALKPAHEPVVVARKPLIGTVAANVLAHGTGALNVDGCRIGTDDTLVRPEIPRNDNEVYGKGLGAGSQAEPAGRWPANVILDEHQAAALDEQSGETVSPTGPVTQGGMSGYDPGENAGTRPRNGFGVGYADIGGASRFFLTVPIDDLDARFTYVPKAGSDERPSHNGTSHATVKPLALMRWLVRLVTPPGGTVLEPFAGSGTTAEACLLERFHCIAIEREADYLPLIVQRINRRRDPIAYLTDAGHDLGLFADEETA